MFMIFERIVPFNWLLMFTVPRGKEKSPELEGGSGHPPHGDGGGGGGASGWCGGFFFGFSLPRLFKRSGQQGVLSGKTMVKMRKLLAYYQNLKFFLSILAINNHRSLVLYYRRSFLIRLPSVPLIF